MEISGTAESVRVNSLRMLRKSFSSRIRYNFSLWTKIRDDFFVNRLAQTLNSLSNTIATYPSLYSFKPVIDGQFK